MDAVATKPKRLELPQAAKDRLWSESGGHCQNPQCRADLHGFASQIHVRELAHIIPASVDGPRGAEAPELTSDERTLPENILVLCPTCHTVIDKAPDKYPADVLRGWKRASQDARARAFGTPLFASRAEARQHVEVLLAANRAVFELYGPREGVFDDDRADQWHRHVKSTIIPNNGELLRLLRTNQRLLTGSERATMSVFAVHVRELEDRHVAGDWTPGSTRFPPAMESILED